MSKMMEFLDHMFHFTKILQNASQENQKSYVAMLQDPYMLATCLAIIVLSWLSIIGVRINFPKSFFFFFTSLTLSYVAVIACTVFLTLSVWVYANKQASQSTSTTRDDTGTYNSSNTDPDTTPADFQRIPADNKPNSRHTPTPLATPAPPD